MIGLALKVPPDDLAQSQERLDRCQREAETLAALDHPKIVSIYSVEEADGVRFLTMQLVEGEKLSGLSPRGGMPLEQIFEVAIPLADALAAAHEKGVIHRDLEPGTMPYMSPEQLEDTAIDSRADLFWLGVVLYEMATRCRVGPPTVGSGQPRRRPLLVLLGRLYRDSGQGNLVSLPLGMENAKWTTRMPSVVGVF